MPDREKVVNALECCIDGMLCAECGYEGIDRCFDKVLLADALALLKDEKEYCDKCAKSAIKTTVELQEEIARLRSLLKEQEAVVRCKDCKHGGCRTQHIDGSIFRVVCKKHSTKRNERWMDADWFCADGERKEGQ